MARNHITNINNGPDKNNMNHADNFISAKEIGTDLNYKHEIVWYIVFGVTILHLLGLWGLAVILTGGIKLKTLIWVCILVVYSTQAVTVGAHRYYTHKSFKASPLLRALFIPGQTLAGTFSMFHWCLVHRLHHRYTDTDGDPHNSTRGFFFSHIGWVCTRGHPYAKKLMRRIDMSDLEADWMVMFQKKYYKCLFIVFSILVPVCVPVCFFSESSLDSFLVCFVIRYIIMIHLSGSVNSFAHLYGTRPYDKNMSPVESWFVSTITLGEGWHNYHHAFPWDYKAAELFNLNLSARTIQLCKKLGLAYDLKTASEEQVNNRICQSGDGTHYLLGNDKARAQVTAAIGPVHPLNPWYTVIHPLAHVSASNSNRLGLSSQSLVQRHLPTSPRDRK